MDILKFFDRLLGRAQLRLFGEEDSLLTFLFHNLFRDETEKDLRLVHSPQGITVGDFRRFVEYYLKCGYCFISVEDVIRGLDSRKQYGLITFDDGYFSHSLALPVLKEYNIPAVFFISTNNVKNNKGFWWDVLYRESLKKGISYKNILRKEEELKKKTAEDIEDYIMENFGENAFCPIGDIDRPFTPSELKSFSGQELVFLGNHTRGHAILTNYSPEGVYAQIKGAQDAIYEMTGKTPRCIAYPSGEYSPEVIKISKEIGLKVGITTFSKKNPLPIDTAKNDASMRLGRFILNGNQDIDAQCGRFRMDFSIYYCLKNLLGRH